MRIGFVGHPAHKWSKSADFFIEILTQIGKITFCYPTAESAPRQLKKLLDEDLDLYVFWQFDFMAYGFLAANKNVVIVPMIDGSATYGSDHWMKIKNARFICFSSNLFTYLKPFGSQRFHIQYYPEPDLTSSSPILQSTYFWLRGSPSDQTLVDVDKLMRNNRDRKILLRLDSNDHEIAAKSKLRNLNLDSRYEIVNVSTREEHLDLLRDCDSFIAPRDAEGIGHSFLEALALGRPVIAKNYPTMNEYVVPHRNGFLYGKNFALPQKPNFEKLGQNAHEDVLLGHEKYISRGDELREFLSEEKHPISQGGANVAAEIMESTQIIRGQFFPRGKNKTLDEHIRIKAASDVFFRKTKLGSSR